MKGLKIAFDVVSLTQNYILVLPLFTGKNKTNLWLIFSQNLVSIFWQKFECVKLILPLFFTEMSHSVVLMGSTWLNLCYELKEESSSAE